MKTIEERAKEWADSYPMTPDGFLTESDMRAVATNSYIQGTTEQNAIDEEVRLKKCDDMTQEECDREAAFAEWYRENGKGTPTYSDAIEWARKEVINEAFKWLKARNVLTDASLKGFRKTMEEQL